MWSTGKKEVHLLRATRTTQTWQRPPALPYAHLRAHLQKSPASCCVFVPGWIKPIGSTPRCVSGCVHPNPPISPIAYSDQMSKSPLVVLWFMKRNGTRLCAGWQLQFWHFSLRLQRSKHGGLCSFIYAIFIYVCTIWEFWEWQLLCFISMFSL